MNVRQVMVLCVLGLFAGTVTAQSSSLYTHPEGPSAGPAAGRSARRSAEPADGRVTAATTIPPEDEAPPAATIPSLLATPKPKAKTFAKEDLITIIIRQQASHSARGDIETSRESTIDGKIDAWAWLHAGKVPVKAVTLKEPPAIKANFDREFEGTGSTGRTDTMSARITGKIVDVKPNGNLVIEASESIRTDEESYTIRVTGICRTRDVTPDNTVLSTQIAELDIHKVSAGAVKDATKRSLFHRLFDWTNLF